MRPRVLATFALVLASALLVAGCGGDDEAGGDSSDSSGTSEVAALDGSFIGCINSGGTMETDASAALQSASRYKVSGNEVKEGSFTGEGGDRRFAVSDDARSNVAVPDAEAADELEKLVWEEGGGGAAMWMGETDQSALVLIAKADTQDRVAELAADYFEPIFDTDPGEDEIGFDEFTSSRLAKVGENAVIVDTNPDGFTERTNKLIEGCE